MKNNIFNTIDKETLNNILRIFGGIIFGILLLLSPWYLPAILDGFFYIIDCLPLSIAIVILVVIILVYPIWLIIVMSIYPANLGGDAVKKSIKELFKMGQK